MTTKNTDDHQGCPYQCTCDKDLSKCCYLVGNHCIISEYPNIKTKKETPQ
ncbi:MAG: hypothetical protein J6Y78_04070 [Paludibacteraceae bacterium]|nr:hypothetical protein [Paludibacteraceae bacterium]